MSDNEAEEDKTSLNDEDIDGWVSDGDLSGLDDEDVDLALADLDTPKKGSAKEKASSSTGSDMKNQEAKSAAFDVIPASVEPTLDVEAVASEVSMAESVAESAPESLDDESKVPFPTEVSSIVADSLPESVEEEQKAYTQGQVSPAAVESVPESKPSAEPVGELAAAPDAEPPEDNAPANDASHIGASTVDTAEEQSASVVSADPSMDDLTPAPEGKLQETLDNTAPIQESDEQKTDLNAVNVASSKPAEVAEGDLTVASSKPVDDTEGDLPLQDGPLAQDHVIEGDTTEAEGSLEPEQPSDFTFSEAKSGHTAEGLASYDMDSPQPLPKALVPPPAAQACPLPAQETSAEEDPSAQDCPPPAQEISAEEDPSAQDCPLRAQEISAEEDPSVQDCPPPAQEISAEEDRARLAGLDRLSMLAEEEPAWGGWGFGGWAKKAVANVSKTVVNVSNVVGEAIENAGEEVGKKLVDLNEQEEEDEDGVHEGTSERGEAPTGPAIEDERKRRELLARLEGNETQLEDNLKALDDKVELLANNAWSAIGTAWTGGLKLAQNAASTAAEELKQGMEEVRELQAQGGGGGFFGGLKAGIEFLKGDREGDGEVGFADISFEHCFYINGGLDFVEDLEALGSDCSAACKQVRADLQGEEKEVFETKLAFLKAVLESMEPCEEDASAPELQAAGDASHGEVVTLTSMRDAATSRAQNMTKGLKEVIKAECSDGPEQPQGDWKAVAVKLSALQGEAMQRLAELCSSSMSQLVQFGASLADGALDAEDGVTWPEEYKQKAVLMRRRGDLMIECFATTSASFQRASEEVMEAAEAAGVGEEIAETVEELRCVVNAANGMATTRVTEGLHHLQYILLSTLLEE